MYVYVHVKLWLRALRSRSLCDRNSLTKAASRPLFVRTRPLRGLGCIMYYNTRRFSPRFLISYVYGIKLYSIGKSVSFASHSIINSKQTYRNSSTPIITVPTTCSRPSIEMVGFIYLCIYFSVFTPLTRRY